MKRLTCLAAVLALLPASWWLAKACAPDFMVAVFSYHRHPDLPRTGFIDGRLAVLQPTFARSYLVIAYRYLNGIGLNPREREQARDYYKDRATGAWDHTGTDWAAEWRTVRARIKSPPAPAVRLITGGTLAYDPETHSFALNCADDAFRIAIHTLDARRTQFGIAGAAFQSWLNAQDKVFANCEGGDPVIPPAPTPDLPAIIRADRNYQIAAAHFYAGEDEAAVAGFRLISQDAASPWNPIAHYLIARTLLRTGETANLTAETNSILADPSLASIHGMTWNLAQRAKIRAHDQAYFRELARLLTTKGQDNGLREELWNYTDAYDSIIDQADPNAIFAPEKPVRADVARFRDADLTDWLFSFQSRDAAVFPHSLQRWQQTRSPAWFLAALSHATAAQAQDEGLLTAAAAIPPNSPAFLTAQFHLQRIALDRGDKPAARETIRMLLRSPALKDLPSSVNLFRGLEMLAAPNLNEFLQFALRKPVMITVQTNIGETPDYFADWPGPKQPLSIPRLDRDAARVLNRDTPFNLLQETALSGALPADLRRESLITAFTRGLMLDQDLSPIAKKLAAAEPDVADLANAYLAETTPAGRRFSAAFLLLRHPEARPYFGTGITRQTAPGKLDSYRDNWWCPVTAQINLDSRATNDDWATPSVLQDSTSAIAPAFLAGDPSAQARRELAQLGKLGAATDFLWSIVLSYAGQHPNDPRLPEALHNLVRSGHYGCTDANTWKSTRAAFRMLHLRYPASDWTKRTPTWFKN
jgi:hypothetical protein